MVLLKNLGIALLIVGLILIVFPFTTYFTQDSFIGTVGFGVILGIVGFLLTSKARK